MLVSNIMIENVVIIQEEDTLEHAALLMQQGRFRHLPVVRRLPQQKEAQPSLLIYPPPRPPVAVIGMLSDRDLPGGRAGVVPPEQMLDRLVQEVMHRPVITVSPDTPVEYAANLMAENAIGCLPVVNEAENGRLVGIITESDLFHALVLLLGAQEPSTRLRLILHGNDPTKLGEILMLLGLHRIHLTSLLTEPVNAEGRWPVTLRVRTIYPEPLLQALK
ncbi:MAG TPA: CBS domain-containing protein, partial [Ktedonobacterales bacterium]|nr:CBS domain-containing protein [Ktedonobacterales bacterium]